MAYPSVLWRTQACIDHIAILRINMKQYNERWKMPSTVFTGISVIWKLMHLYGIPSKFTKLIKNLHEPGIFAFPR